MENIVVTDNTGRPIVYHATIAEVVVPSDTEILETGILFVGTGGNINVLPFEGETAVLFKNVPNGSFFPVKVKKVLNTDTTAGDIVILR